VLSKTGFRLSPLIESDEEERGKGVVLICLSVIPFSRLAMSPREMKDPGSAQLSLMLAP